jgi:hypothetical protein
MSKGKKEPKGKPFKCIHFPDGNAMAMLYGIWQRANHANAQVDNACDMLDTLETFSKEETNDDGSVMGLQFPVKGGTDVVVSIGLHEYIHSVFNQQSPSGAAVRTYRELRRAVADAERVFDKGLMDKGWVQEDGIWYSPEAISRPKSEKKREEKKDDEEGGTGEGGESEAASPGADAAVAETDSRE